MSNSPIGPIGRTLSGATTSGPSGTGGNGNEGLLCIPQIFKAGALPWNCLISYSGISLEGGVLTPLLRWSWCILQPQLTGFHIWGVWNILSLPLLLSPLWPEVVVLFRILSVSLIDLFKNYIWHDCVQKKKNPFLQNNFTKHVNV